MILSFTCNTKLHGLRHAGVWLAAAALLLTACQSPEHGGGGSADPGTVSLDVHVIWPPDNGPSGSAAALTERPLVAPPTVANMKATVTVGTYTVSKSTNAQTQTSDSISNVPPGAGTLQLDALDTAGATLYTGKTAFDGAANTTVPVTVSMAVAPGAPVAPWPPTDLKVVGGTTAAGAGLATLTWTASAGATSYNVYRSIVAAAGTGTNSVKIADVKSPFVNAPIKVATHYFFVVTALNGTLESAASAESGATTGGTALGAPTGVGATPGDKQVVVSWTALTGAASYNVYYSTTSAAGTSGTKASSTTTSSTIVNLTNGTTYYFVVTAIDAAGTESAASTQVSATPQAPPGTLDTTFNAANTPGFAVSAAGGAPPAVVNGIAVDTSTANPGKIYAVGYSQNAGQFMTLWRYNADGTPDNLFGSGVGAGKNFIVDSGLGTPAVGNAVAVVQSGTDAGKIVVVGQSRRSGAFDCPGISPGASSADCMTVWRFTSTGGIDGSFGGNTLHYNFHQGGSAPSVGNALAIDGSGNIVIAGQSLVTIQVMTIWRFLPGAGWDQALAGKTGGSPCPFFVFDNGLPGATTGVGNAVVLDGSTPYKIIVAGSSSVATAQMLWWRYNNLGTSVSGCATGSAGAFDIFPATTQNYVNSTAGQSTAVGKGVARDGATGNILITGQAGAGSMALWRYLPSGSPDTTFGSPNGYITVPATQGTTAIGNALALVSGSNKIVVAGSSTNTLPTGVTVWRFGNNGAADTGFGANGFFAKNGTQTGSNDAGNALVLDANGKILVGGFSSVSGAQSGAVWRVVP